MFGSLKRHVAPILAISAALCIGVPATSSPLKISSEGLNNRLDVSQVRHYRNHRYRSNAAPAVLGILALGTAAAIASNRSRYDECGYYSNCGYNGYGGNRYYGNGYYGGRSYSQYPRTRDYYGGYGHTRHYYGNGYNGYDNSPR